MTTNAMCWTLLLVLHLTSAARGEGRRRISPSVSPLYGRNVDESLISPSGSEVHGKPNHKEPQLPEAEAEGGQGSLTSTERHEHQLNETNSAENHLGNINKMEELKKKKLSENVINQTPLSGERKKDAVNGTNQDTLQNTQKDSFMRTTGKIASNDTKKTKVNGSLVKENIHEESNLVEIDISDRWQKMLSLFSDVSKIIFNNVKQNGMSNILSVNRLETFQSYFSILESEILNFLQDNIAQEIFKFNATLSSGDLVSIIRNVFNYKKENIGVGIAQFLIAGARTLVEQYISGSPGSVLNIVANTVFGQVSDTSLSSQTSRTNFTRSMDLYEWMDAFENNKDDEDISDQPWTGYWTDIEDGEQRTRDVVWYSTDPASGYGRHDISGPASGHSRNSQDSDSFVYYSDAPKLDPGEFTQVDDGIVYATDEPQFDLTGFTHDKDAVVPAYQYVAHSHGKHAFVDDGGMHVIGHSKIQHDDFTHYNDDVVQVIGHSQPDYRKFTHNDDDVVYVSGPSRDKHGHNNDGGGYLGERFKPDRRHERNNDDVVYSNTHFERHHPAYTESNDDVMYVKGHSNRGHNDYSHNNDVAKKLVERSKYYPSEVISNKRNLMSIDAVAKQGRRDIGSPHNILENVFKGRMPDNRELRNSEYGRGYIRVPTTSGGQNWQNRKYHIYNKNPFMYSNDISKLKSVGRPLEYDAHDRVAVASFSTTDEYKSRSGSDGLKYAGNIGPDRLEFRNNIGPNRFEFGSNIGPDKLEHGSNIGPDKLEHGSNIWPDRLEFGSNIGPDRLEFESNIGPDKLVHGSIIGPDGLEYRSRSVHDRLEFGGRSGPVTLEYGSLSGPESLIYGSSSESDQGTVTNNVNPPPYLKGLGYYGLYELIALGGAWLIFAYITYKLLAVAAPKTTSRWLSGSRGLQSPGGIWDDANIVNSILKQISSAKHKYRDLQQDSN